MSAMAPTAAAPTEVPSPPAPPAPAHPRERGVLIVRSRAVEQLADASTRTNPEVWQSETTVLRLDDDGVDLSIEVVIRYPRTALSGILAGLRRAVAEDVGRMLGRPVRRLDIVVDEFVASEASRRRSG
jgi:hypothetical protein